MRPLVSVVLPVFNNAAYLPELLESLLSQSERSLEVVAVDDGSTDCSLALLRDAARSDPRLIVLTQDNHGVSAARNAALRRVRGRWIAFADSDDWLSHDTLRTWCAYAQSERLDLLVGNGFSFCDRPDEAVGLPRVLLESQPWGEVVDGRAWICSGVANEEWPHYVWLQLARRELVTGCGARFVEDMTNHSDIVWTLGLALKARRVGFLEQPLYGYRINPTSLSRNPSAFAIGRRARSYLIAMERLLQTALKEAKSDVGLHDALLRHTCFESRNFLSLIRKRLHDRTIRRELAADFLKLGLTPVMFSSAANASDLWRATRSWIFVQWAATARSDRSWRAKDDTLPTGSGLGPVNTNAVHRRSARS